MLHELYIRYMVTEAITTLTGSEPLLQYIVTGGLLIEHVLLRQWIENRGASQYIFKWQVFNVCRDMYGMCSTEQFVSYLTILHELHYLVCVCMLMIYFCTNCIISPDSGGHVMVLMVFTLPVEIFTLVFIWAALP